MSVRSDLELVAAQALFAARLLERAVHDEGPWTMRWGTIEVPATRTVTEAGVVFEAEFPQLCYLEPPGPNVLLLCRGEVGGIRAVDHPGDTAFVIVWSLTSAQASVR